MKRIIFWTVLGTAIGLLVGCDADTLRASAEGAAGGAAQGFATGGPIGALIGAIGGALTGGGAAWKARDSKRDKMLGQVVQGVGMYLNQTGNSDADRQALLDALSRNMDSEAKDLVTKLKAKLGVE